MDNPDKRVILITGAAGFIGSRLSTYFASKGYDVRGLVRDEERALAPIPEGKLFLGDLPKTIDRRAFEGVDVLIHCAYRTQYSSKTSPESDNEESTKAVFRLSRNANVGTFVFFSSLSAHENARSYYGRSKFALEKIFDPDRDLVIRPGLVLGGKAAGLFGRMIESLMKYPIVPLLDGGKQMVQTIYIDDLCKGIHIALQKRFTGAFSLADPNGVTMKELLQYVINRSGRKTKLLPVPSALVLLPVRLIELMNIPFPVTSENILGLQHMQFVETQSDLDRLGLTLLTPSETLDKIFSAP